MKIIRRNEYVAVSVRLLRDAELSIRAKGVLAVLAAMPEAAALTEYDLCSVCRMTLEDADWNGRVILSARAARSMLLTPLKTAMNLNAYGNGE